MTAQAIEKLVCPSTGQGLTMRTLDELEGSLGPLTAGPDSVTGRTPEVLVRDDLAGAYPVVGAIPILLEPEMLTNSDSNRGVGEPRWIEAYQEMEFYNSFAELGGSGLLADVETLVAMRGCPSGSADWVDAPYDAAAQLEAIQHLCGGAVFLQLGGKGLHAVKALLAGATDAWLVTPMLSEAQYAVELATRLGVNDRFYPVVGLGEQLPFASNEFDSIYTGGCLHHMICAHAALEFQRVLGHGGRFAAVEPWRTTLNTIGTKLVGKREANAFCHPMTPERLQPLVETFALLQINHHGPLLRSLALGVLKVTKRPLSPRAGLLLGKVDDALPLPNVCGGSVAILGEKASLG